MVLHKDQRKFISEKADELSSSDLAQESCTVRISELKSSWMKHKKDPALCFLSLRITKRYRLRERVLVRRRLTSSWTCGLTLIITRMALVVASRLR